MTKNYSNQNFMQNKMIPTVKKYFMDLDIPAELLARVTEIDQYPNNAVVRELIPIWDGQGNEFVIKSAEDVKLVPNLKKATIFVSYSVEEDDDEYFIFRELAAKGIEAYGYGISKRGTPSPYKKVEEFKKKALDKVKKK
ncbi:MAG TPA: hypothetical protein VNZ45_06945 [Bacteroidia bacterium]|jgi:hypothetical protein|nr:hypothetical protein [Bacteroidia bacterium]